MENEQTVQSLQNQVKQLKQEVSDFQKNEKMFHALVESAVGDIGEDFFNNIVIKLSAWLNVDCVIIGLKVDENKVEGFPTYLDGNIIKGFSYNLSGTPCDLTTKKGYCIYKENVREFFPGCKDLIELNIQGYVGSALYNKEGKTKGILCAMSRNKLDLPPQAEDIMRIVGARITAEIDRISAQKALEISERKLRTVNASKDRFFSIIAHDLKSPFNSLIGFSKLLLEHIQKNKFDKIEKYVHIIYDVSLQTHTLLSNLLEWSIVQTNNIKYNPKYINLQDIFSEAVEFNNRLAIQKNITLTYSVPDDMNAYGDANMVAIILRNLISNAVKYTSPGGFIALTASFDTEKTTVFVTDSGIGISPENIEKLFKIENSFSTNGTNEEKGTGLGLILCKELIEKHKGEIQVESKVGKGSTFIFTLPHLKKQL